MASAAPSASIRLNVSRLVPHASLTTVLSAKPALDQFLNGSQDALFLDQIATSDLEAIQSLSGARRVEAYLIDSGIRATVRALSRSLMVGYGLSLRRRRQYSVTRNGSVI